MEELLPVGSKVELHSKRKFVIIGYLPSKPNDEKQYDYICCRDRYGINWKKDKLVFDKHYFYINKEDIERVLYIGYSDEKFDIFNHSLLLVKDKLKKAKKAKDTLTEEEVKEVYVDALGDFIGEIGELKNEG